VCCRGDDYCSVLNQSFRFNVQKFYVLPTECICVCCTNLKNKQNQLICSYNQAVTCLLRGTNWVFKYVRLVFIFTVGRDSSVGIATCYELGGPGIKSRWGQDFPHPSTRDLGPIQPAIPWALGLFLGVKQLGHGVLSQLAAPGTAN
jgi:hypothetical protein